jgi:hypothetical protein
MCYYSEVSPRIGISFALAGASCPGALIRTNCGGEAVGSDLPASQTGIFVRNGEYWTIGLGGQVFSLRDIVGLSYIQFLLQHPGEEFHALAVL